MEKNVEKPDQPKPVTSTPAPAGEVDNGVEYSEAIAHTLCAYLSEGLSLRRACEQDGMPSRTTVFRWLHKNPEFVKLYEKAKEESADALAEDILDIADDSTNDFMTVTRGRTTMRVLDKEAVERSKLRISSRQWLMGKQKAKKYGDKLDLTSDNKPLPTPIYAGLANSDPKKKKRGNDDTRD